jgi:glycosyltransferase involved in cell wall biosynthesis
MKLLMLNWKDLKNPTSGGAEVLTEGILKQLASQGWDITLFCCNYPGGLLEEKIDGYTVIRKGRYWTVQLWAFIYWFIIFKKQNFTTVIDQIHGIPFFSILYMKKVKIYAFIHEVAKEIWFSMFKYPLNWIGYIVELMYLKMYKNTAFITVSPSTQEDLISSGVPQKNITIIPEAINYSPIHVHFPKEQDPTIIYLGRLAAMKQVNELIRAAAIARKSIPKLQLWLVGGGEAGYIEKLKTEAQELSVPATFFGKVSEEEKYELLSRAWILSSASVKEGFGLVIIEAATQGTPSVVYNVKGFKDAVLNGKTGLLSKQTTEDLAKNILYLIQDKNKYSEISKNAQEYSKQFTFQNAAAEFNKIISQQ